MVDVKDFRMGAWFEVKVMDIFLIDENDLSFILYYVVYDG